MMIDIPSKQQQGLPSNIKSEIASKEELIRLRREEIERKIAKKHSQLSGLK